jgi:tetratricopeptide (TPR) repeat protein
MSNVGRTEKIVQIAVYFKNAFQSFDQNMAGIGGVFQISDSPRESAAPQTGAGSVSSPSTVAEWINKGNDLGYLKKYDEAIKAYDEAIRLDSNNVLAWYTKGIALDNMGKYDEAIKASDEAIRLDPEHKWAWYTKGLALKALGRTTEANAAFAKAKELGYSG